MTEINILNRGNLNLIPKFETGRIVELSGINGIGKTKTATYLEILSNNYEFPDKKNFDFYRSGTNEIAIEIKINEDSLRGVLTPNKWKYDLKTKKIVPSTIGTYYLNNKNIDYKIFKTTIDVKIIRGDESLEKQVENISSFILNNIIQELQTIEDFEKELMNYRKSFESEVNLSEVNTYQVNTERAANIHSNIQQNLNNHTITTENLNKASNQVQNLSDLQYRLKYDQIKIQDEMNVLERKISDKKGRIDAIEKTINIMTDKVQQEDSERNVPINKIKKRNKIEKEMQSLKIELQSLDPRLFQESTILNDDIIKIIEAQDNQLALTEKQLKEYQDDKSDIVFIANKINAIKDISLEAIDRNLGETIAFNLEIKELTDPYNVTFSELELNTTQSLINNINAEELEKIQLEFIKITELQNSMNKIKNKALEFAKLFKKHKQLNDEINQKVREQKIDYKIEQYLTQITKATETKKTIEHELEELLKNKTSHNNILNNLNERATKDDLISSLQELDFPITELLNDPLQKDKVIALETQIDSLTSEKEELTREKIYLERQIENFDSQAKQLKIIMDKQEVDLKATATHQGFRVLNEWILYILKHKRKIETLINKVDTLKTNFNNLIKNLNRFKEKTSERITNKDQIIINHIATIFNDIFLELYNKPVFFEHVFKEFTSMKSFDIDKREIEFLTSESKSVHRKLAEFSSGEKSFAYIRALMSIDETGSRFRIIILDESNALLDRIKSDALLEYQKVLIDSGSVFKILNILPAREKLEEKIAYYEQKAKNGTDEDQTDLNNYYKYKESFTTHGYFQKILY